MEIISSRGSTLDLSDLASHCSSSGLIPEISTGLSLTYTSDSSCIDHSSNSTRKGSVKWRVPLLHLAKKDEVGDKSPCTLNLAEEFPGVHKVLRETALLFTSDETSKPHYTDNLSAPPLLTLPPTMPTGDDSWQAYVPTMLQLDTPKPHPHAPPPSVTTFLHPHAVDGCTVRLPEIPIRQFIPQLIPPDQLQGSRVVPPPLLVINDPLSRMRKEGFELLRLPAEQEGVELRERAGLGESFLCPHGDDTVTIRTCCVTNHKRNRDRRRRRRRSYKLQESPTLLHQAPTPCTHRSPSPPPSHTPPSLSSCTLQSPSHSRSSSLTSSFSELKVNGDNLKDGSTQGTFSVANDNPTPPPSSPPSLIAPPPSSPASLIAEDLVSQPTLTTPPPSPQPSLTAPPPSSQRSPVTHSVAIQVEQAELKSAEVQVGIPWQQCTTELNPAETPTVDDGAGHRYLMVTDIENEETSSSEEDISTEGSGMVRDEGSIVLLSNTEENSVTNSDEERRVTEVLATKICPLLPPKNVQRTSDDVFTRFEQLKDQLSAIEITANGMKNEFVNSRMMLHTIDRISTTNRLMEEPHPPAINKPVPMDISYRPRPLLQEGPGTKTATPLADYSNRTVTKESHDETIKGQETKSINGRLSCYGDSQKTTTNTKRKELKAWMKRKRKESVSEYLREREVLIAREREPFTPRRHKMANSGPSSIEDPNTMKERRRLRGISDHSHRIQEAHQLITDLLVSEEHGGKPSLNDSSKYLNSLAQNLSLASSPLRPTPTPWSTASQEVEEERRRRRGSKREDSLKRRFSSIEGLNKTEQLKMAEILASVQIEAESVDTAVSSIDWSEVDELLTGDDN